MKWLSPIEIRQRKFAQLARGKILDVGYADHPNPYLQGEITGLDLIKRPTPTNYQKTVTGDAHKLDQYFSAKFFDTITAAEVIEHLEHPARFLRAARTVLKDKGTLFISTPNPYYPPTFFANVFFLRPEKTAHNTHDPYHINLFTYRNMVTLLEHCDFTLVDVQAITGLVINFNTGPVLPLPKPFCQNFLYLVRKR